MIPSRDMVDHQDATGGRCPVHGTRLVLVMAAVLAGVLLAVWGGQGGSWSPRPALAVDWNVIQVPFESSYILPYKLTENYLLFSAGEDSQAELYVYDIGADSVDQLTFNEYEDGLADMDGSYAVWSAKADGDYEIFLRNLATDQTTRLTNNSEDEGRPRIAGNCVAWTGSDGNDLEVFLYLIDSQEIRQLTSNTWDDGDFDWVSTDGRFVCWHDAPRGDQGRWVYLYDTVDEVTYHYYGGKDDGWCQVGDGHWVWLHSAADGTTTVYYHDMYEQSTTVYAISPPGQNCSFPLPYMVRVVDDDYVVWSVEQGSLSTLVLHRLSTDSDQTLAGPGRIDWAQVSDGIVAWIQDDGGVADVWAHDIIDGSTVRLTDDEFDEEFVLAGPDGVAWNRLGGMEGYQLWVALKATAEKPIFVDVPWLQPYREAIEGLYRGGVVSGSRVIGDERYFDPQNPVRRAQFAKMIVGTLGLPPAGTTQTRFLDLGSPDAFGYPHIYVQVAYDHGITNGTNPAQSLFAPWNYIRRDQVVSMIVRAAVSEAPGVLQNPPPGHPSYFAGVPEPHGANLRIAEYNGLMAGLTGFGSGWSESQNASRGEVAQMLWNLLGKIGE